MSDYRLESHVNEDGIVMMHLKGKGHVVAFASFHVDVMKEFYASLLILKDKMEAAGLVVPSDLEIQGVPTADGPGWS